ncbi:MAG TPA: LysR family transcriptional regulator [Firmicutes bacterium]|nr:LysR family transcriptional regulator [Bacillota bacterium]
MNGSRVSLDLYRVFYTVARCRSITLAAGELYLSQPAVSRSVGQLERALDCRLFLRTSKGVELTSEGEALYAHVAAGIARFEMGERELRERRNLEAGEIRVGASDMTLRFFLLPHLERFHTLYPRIKISVTNGPTPETLRALEQRTIDFGVVSRPTADSGAGRPDGDAGGPEGLLPNPGTPSLPFVFTPVGRVQDIVIAGPRFADLARRTLALRELESLPLILLEKDTSTRRYLDGFFTAAGLRLQPEFELATSDLIVRFVQRNLGIGCVVEDFAAEALGNGTVFRLRPDVPIPPRRLCVVQSGQPVSRAAQRLLELILNEKA